MNGEEPEGAVQDPVGETPPEEEQPVEAEILELPQADAEIEQLKAENKQLNDKYVRSLADYDNLKRRSADEVQRRVDAGVNAIFKGLIDLADDFERAFADDGTGNPETWREGVRLIQQKLLKLLRDGEVSPIAALGMPFDPDYHEALGQAPGPQGEIVAELRRGYLSNGRVLRASQVMIGAGAPEPQPDPEPEPAAAGDPADEQEEDPEWHE